MKHSIRLGAVKPPKIIYFMYVYNIYFILSMNSLTQWFGWLAGCFFCCCCERRREREKRKERNTNEHSQTQTHRSDQFFELGNAHTILGIRIELNWIWLLIIKYMKSKWPIRDVAHRIKSNSNTQLHIEFGIKWNQRRRATKPI